MCLQRLGVVVSLPGSEEAVAIVESEGVLHRASTVLLALEGVEVRPGDWLAIHTGLALRVVPAAEADEVLRVRAGTREVLDGRSGHGGHDRSPGSPESETRRNPTQ